MAAVQGLHRRRARERGLDGAHRQRRVQPVARRLVRQRRALRPELPALAEQRPASRRRPGPTTATTSASRSRIGGARRRRRASSTASTRATRVCSRRSARRRRRARAAAGARSTSAVEAARRAFTMTDPSASCPALARGLERRRATRSSDSRPSRMRSSCCGSRSGSSRTRSTPRSGSSSRRRRSRGHGRADRAVRGVRAAAVDGGAGARPDVRGARALANRGRWRSSARRDRDLDDAGLARAAGGNGRADVDGAGAQPAARSASASPFADDVAEHAAVLLTPRSVSGEPLHARRPAQLVRPAARRRRSSPWPATPSTACRSRCARS